MSVYIHSLAQKYKYFLSSPRFLWSLIFGIILLFASLVINFYAGMYATESASNPVTDIILSNIRVYDVGVIFIYGPTVLTLFVLMLCALKPERFPFLLKSVALFVVIRAIFVTLTHIGPFPTQSVIDFTGLFGKFIFYGDLFFSGHVGISFLLALIFWKNTYLRIIFVAFSILFGIVVLAAHLHYSIDVLAAFFITYTIYHIALKIFKKDHALFMESM